MCLVSVFMKALRARPYVAVQNHLGGGGACYLGLQIINVIQMLKYNLFQRFTKRFTICIIIMCKTKNLENDTKKLFSIYLLTSCV